MKQPTFTNHTTIGLTLTIVQNDKFVTMPLTIWLVALWMLAAFPLLASCCEAINRILNATDMAVAGIIILITTFIILCKEVRSCLSLS